jgi:uncharacterized membrane protein YraQ (UPF0718 family)
MEFLNNLLHSCLEASPWLVFGFIIGGSFKAFLSTSFLKKHLQGNGILSIIKSALLGAPLPLCSCGVIPAALGLYKGGASKPATVSFLVSTPETGVDSIGISYALLGPVFAVTRPIVALFSAITTGILVMLFDKNKEIETKQTTSCCGSKKATKEIKETKYTQISKGVFYAFTDLFDKIIFWLCVGMIFSALVQTFLPKDFLLQWGNGFGAMIAMLFVGIPLYVCATASTPIAAGLILAGISPGAALVFLLVGPATNISTMGIIAKNMGKKTLALYLMGVGSVAIISGLSLNFAIDYMSWDIQIQQANTAMLPAMVQYFCLALLFFIATRKLFLNKIIAIFKG